MSKISERRKARKLLVQALYQWHMSNNDVQAIEEEFQANDAWERVDQDYFSKLLHDIPSKVSELDELLAAQTDRPLVRLDPISLSVLRLGCYELKYQLELPFKVVINEAVDLTKCYGAQDSHKYVNSILDKLVKHLRPHE